MWGIFKRKKKSHKDKYRGRENRTVYGASGVATTTSTSKEKSNNYWIFRFLIFLFLTPSKNILRTLTVFAGLALFIEYFLKKR